MKAIFALVVVLAAVASAQYGSAQESALHENSYLNTVEYVDQLDSPPNPSLIPKYFIEQAGIGKKIKKGVKGVKKVVKKVAKAAAKHAKQAAKQMAKLAKALAGGGPGAKFAKKKMQQLKKSLKKDQKKMTKAQREQLKKTLEANKKRIAKAKAAARHAKHKQDRAAAKRRAAAKAHQDMLDKRAKRTDSKVQRAMKKIRRLSHTMTSLKKLMTTINGQVQTLLPGERIKKYKLDDVAAISNSKRSKTLTKKESKLVNPFNKNPKKGQAYGKSVIPKDTKVIKKGDDLAVQDIASKQKTLHKFTGKLAKKDKVALVF